jgi:DNA modification methylase
VTKKVIGDAVLYQGDCLQALKALPEGSVQCVVTSPPYWGLRDYGVKGQLGMEKTPEEYIVKVVAIFRELRRVLRDDGTLWLNLGDSYAGSGKGIGSDHGKAVVDDDGYGKKISLPAGLKPKDLIGIPWRVALALQADGWYLRSDIIWSKPNPMPESVTDRPTKSHEYVFLLTKSAKYFYDAEAIKEPTTTFDENLRDRDTTRLNNTPGRTKMGGLKRNNYTTRNKRTVWTVATKAFADAHFAVFPEKLIEPCILAGCPVGGTTLDPFNGSGTTGIVSVKNQRKYIGIDLNPAYIEMSAKRIEKAQQQISLFDKKMNLI